MKLKLNYKNKNEAKNGICARINADKLNLFEIFDIKSCIVEVFIIPLQMLIKSKVYFLG